MRVTLLFNLYIYTLWSVLYKVILKLDSRAILSTHPIWDIYPQKYVSELCSLYGSVNSAMEAWGLRR